MFDIHDSPDWEDEDDAKVAEYCEELMRQFAESPQGRGIGDRYDEAGWAGTFLNFGYNYLGEFPPGMSVENAREIVFSIFPRKVTTEPESADQIIDELNAFWVFLGQAYELPNAPEMIALLGDQAKQDLRDALADPRNFGMAKSLLSMGREAGFDMTTQDGLDEFAIAYNEHIAQTRMDEPSQAVPPAYSTARSPIQPNNRETVAERKSRRKLLRKKMAKPKRSRRK